MASRRLESPYPPFFLAGTLAALVGVGVWAPYAWWPEMPYPGRFHAHVMMGLFLSCFAVGFLMTALPRMIASFPTSRPEFVVASLILGFQATVALGDPSERAFFAGALGLSLFFLYFAGRRIRRRRNDLPELFPLVLWGWLSSAAGAALFLCGQRTFGERLYYLNFMLCLVLGVGMRLLPTLLRLPARTNPWGARVYGLLGALLALACWAEGTPALASAATWTRALCVSLVAVFGWRLFRPAPFRSGSSWGLLISGASVMISVWGLALFPYLRLEFLHLLYVSGFALMTFMVAARVILAHGGHGIENEVGNPWLKLAVACVALASLTRFAAIFVPSGYERHLSYAAWAFLAGVAAWSRYFLPRLAPAADVS